MLGELVNSTLRVEEIRDAAQVAKCAKAVNRRKFAKLRRGLTSPWAIADVVVVVVVVGCCWVS